MKFLKTPASLQTYLTSLQAVSESVVRAALVTMLSALVAASVGCASGSDSESDDGGGDTPSNPGSGPIESSFSIPLRTNSSGLAQAEFTLAEGSTKFAITAFPPSTSNRIRFVNLSSASGANFLNPGGQEISFADFLASGVNAINAPSRDVDPNLNSGETYTVTIEAASAGGNALADSDVTLVVSSRDDGDLSSGSVVVNIFFVGELAGDNTVRTVVDQALTEFRAIYSSQLGINLDVRTFDVDGSSILPSPFEGSSFYGDLTSSVGGLGINIFIGGDVANSGGEILGIAGGIIAPPIPSTRSALAVGIIPGAGPDGVYSAEDIRVLGETMAHESGHYAGLFHPVDFAGQTASATDPLSDTATCSSFTACLGDNSLVTNLMFTSPISDGAGGLIPQNQLTSDQRGVVNRYAAVN